MSNEAFASDVPLACQSSPCEDTIEVLESRVATVGERLTIRRALPLAKRRMIGAWCFLDHFGPHEFNAREQGMWVGAHPHIGLQTVTWLFDGAVLHRDSLGTVARIEPGGLNVMTAGHGISHTEESPSDHEGKLHGLQLWVALPEASRDGSAEFQHVAELPKVERAGMNATVFAGQGLGVTSAAKMHTPILGAEVKLSAAGTHQVPLAPEFEHGVVVSDGRVRVNGRWVGVGELLYLKPGRRELILETEGPARFGLVGGEPFPEPILLWWNFVGRSHEEIVEARNAWLAGLENTDQRFGEVHGFEGDRLDIPELHGRLVAR